MGSVIKDLILQDPQGCLSCLFMLIVTGLGWLSVTGKTRTRRYTKPRITGARISRADLWHNGEEVPIGEFDVEAGHSSHVTRSLQLPSGAWVKGQGHGRYKVQFDLPAYLFRTDQPQEVHDLWYVTSLAESNGYDGKIEYGRTRSLENPSRVVPDARLDLVGDSDGL